MRTPPDSVHFSIPPKLLRYIHTNNQENCACRHHRVLCQVDINIDQEITVVLYHTFITRDKALAHNYKTYIPYYVDHVY